MGDVVANTHPKNTPVIYNDKDYTIFQKIKSKVRPLISKRKTAKMINNNSTQELFACPQKEDWEKIYEKLKPYESNQTGKNPCPIFNQEALPNPKELTFYKSDMFERAMDWRYTLIWAERHELLNIVKSTDFRKELFRENCPYSYTKDDYKVKLSNILDKHFEFKKYPEDIYALPGLKNQFPDIIGRDELHEVVSVAAIIGINKTSEKGMYADKDDLMQLALFCSKTLLIPELLMYDESLIPDTDLHPAYFHCPLFPPVWEYSYGESYIPKEQEPEYRSFIFQTMVNALNLCNAEILIFETGIWGAVRNIYCQWEIPGTGEYTLGLIYNKIAEIMREATYSSGKLLHASRNIDYYLTDYEFDLTWDDEDLNKLIEHKKTAVSISKGSPIVYWRYETPDEIGEYIFSIDFDNQDKVTRFIMADYEKEQIL